MNYQKLIEQLPKLSENWEQESGHPKSNKFQVVLEEIPDQATANLLQLCDLAADCLAPGEVYCQIGYLQNIALIGILLNHPEQLCYVVDDFLAFDLENEKLEKWSNQLIKLGVAEKVFLCNQNFEQFFQEWDELKVTEKIGLYFYDGDSDYHSVLLGLLLVKPFLTDQALLLINNRGPSVKQAITDFMIDHSTALRISPEIPSISILKWDIEKSQTSSLNLGADRHYIDAYHHLGNILCQKGDFPSAEKIYRQAIAVQPENIDNYLNLGNVLSIQGIADESLITYEKALLIEPDHPEILSKLEKVRNHILASRDNWKKLDLSWTLLSGLTIKIENRSEWFIYNEIFVEGEYDFAIKQALNSVKPDQVFRCLDLGANVGFFTMRLADLIMREKPQINFEVTLIEGSPQVFSNLQSRMSKINILQDKIKLIWGLAGHSQGSEKIFESDFFPAANSIFSESAKIKGIDVQYIDLMTLSSPAQKIDLLKCDIEGSELILLENYPALFNRVNYAIFELHENYCDPNKCIQLLKNYGLINHIRLREEYAIVEFFWK